MAGWPRVIRAMIVTGLTFAAGVGVAVALVGLVVVLVAGGPLREVLEMAGRFSVVSFLVGVAFAGILAITARSGRLAALSIPRVASLGAGAGLLYFLFLAVNGGRNWSLANAIANLAILTLLGGGSAAATLILARKGRPELRSGEDSRYLDDG